MKKTLLFTVMMLAIAACAIEPPKPLEQQLAETSSPAQRKETLRVACLKEAEWPNLKSRRSHAGSQHRHGSHSPYTSEARDMNILCRQMDALTDSAPVEKLSPEILAGKCAEQVAEKSKKDRKGNAEHIVRVQKICKEMTAIKMTR